MINIIKSKNGEPTAKINNNFVHSSYSPYKEAEKFFSVNNLNTYTTFIIIGPCLNYLSAVIRKKIPDAKIISIYLNYDFFCKDKNISDQAILFDNNLSIGNLKAELDFNETDIAGLKIIIWPMIKNIFSEKIQFINKVLMQKVRELHGNITTLSGFGKKMFRNYIRNYFHLQSNNVFLSNNVPVIITGSGPGLYEDILFLKEKHGKYILLALPSSLEFLNYNNIIPDIIISTDPGYYASLHLNNYTDIPIASPYSASLPDTNLSKIKHLLLNQHHILDGILLGSENNHYKVAQNGTVAGSALMFCYNYFKGPVFLSGLDFSYIDCLSHVKPHSFDSLLQYENNRTAPLSDIYFKRNIVNSQRIDNSFRRTTKSLLAYSGWFSDISSFFYDRVYFLNYFKKTPGDFKNIDYTAAGSFLNENKRFDLKSQNQNDINLKKLKLESSADYLIKSIDNIIEKISVSTSAYDIYNHINNELFLNILMPELLEYKRHFVNKDINTAKEKAFHLTGELKSFIEGLNHYA